MDIPVEIIPVLAGLMAGLIHVLAGPDHLAAVAPLTIDRKFRPWLTGLWWGSGHAAGVLLIGVGVLLFREMLPLNWLSTFGERLVGVALIGIGVWGLRRGLSGRLHSHEHVHDGVRHSHIHLHDAETGHAGHLHQASGESESAMQTGHAHTHLPLLMGILHAFAGTANLLGVLPALAIPGTTGAVLYLVAFGVGSVAAMSVFSWGLAASMAGLQHLGLRPYRIMLTGCSASAMVIGGVWLVS